MPRLGLEQEQEKERNAHIAHLLHLKYHWLWSVHIQEILADSQV